MNVLGLSCYYHDAAACLIVNGRVVAGAAEERLTRIKHDNAFPLRAATWCLEWANIKPQEVDVVAFYEKPLLKFERILSQHVDSFPKSSKIFRENIGSWFSYKLRIRETLRKTLGYSGRTMFIPHHTSHASSAFFLSGFDKATIVSVDGVGEWATTAAGTADSRGIHIKREIRFPHSLGLLYSAVTAFLGFEVNDAEYKVMGYAAYGDPSRFRSSFQELIERNRDGSFFLNLDYFDYVWSDRMANDKLSRLFGVPPRTKESGIQQIYADIAAALQEALELTVFNLIDGSIDRYGSANVCLSGGVALNSVMNGKILSNTKARRIFIPPDPGDGGAAMGAALYASFLSGVTPQCGGFSPAIGPSFPDDMIEDALKARGISYKRAKSEDSLIREVASYLTRQKVIGWFQGRMEWGPRALGFRSILASPTRASMKDIINTKIKHRELFRPFAPAILEHYAKSYFRSDNPLPHPAKYMLFVYPFSKVGKTRAPATVHVDGTGRLQTVSRDDNRPYYDLIEEFRKLTGVPVILNTSFNVRGEPIVCNPRDAIECFMKTDIDYLVIGPFIAKKRHGKGTV